MNSFSAEHLMNLVYNGTLTQQDLLEMCLNFMTDEELCEMMECNELPFPEEDADMIEDVEEDVDWTEDTVDYNSYRL